MIRRFPLTPHQIIITVLAGALCWPMMAITFMAIEMLHSDVISTWNKVGNYALLYAAAFTVVGCVAHPQRAFKRTIWYICGVGLSLWAPLALAMLLTGAWIGVCVNIIVAFGTLLFVGALYSVYYHQDIFNKETDDPTVDVEPASSQARPTPASVPEA